MYTYDTPVSYRSKKSPRYYIELYSILNQCFHTLSDDIVDIIYIYYINVYG